MTANIAPERPPIWYVAPTLLPVSEVWLWRQMRGMSQTKVVGICTKRMNENDYPISNIDVVVAPIFPQPEHGKLRWLNRLWAVPTRNFWGCMRAERLYYETLAVKYPPACILAHFGPIALKMLPVAMSLGVPIIVHFHGYDLSTMLRNRWYRWSLQANLKRFSAIIVVGRRQEEWVLANGAPRQKVHRIACGVPTNEFLPASSKKIDDVINFICVGRLVDVKGFDLTLQAFAKAMAQRRNIRLAIVGDGPNREALERLSVELSIASSVVFHGPLPSHEVANLLQKSDIFMQHSRTTRDGQCEGFGVTVAEASACALPVIVTRSGGILDQVVDGETGIMVDELDVDGQAAAMLRLIDNADLRQAMGRAGRKRMIAEFDTVNQIRKLEDVLLTITRMKS